MRTDHIEQPYDATKLVTRQLGRDGQPQRFKPEDLPVEPIVGPLGQFQHHRPRSNGGGASPCKWDAENEVLVIPKKYRLLGWCFYRDMCAGNYQPVDGGEPVSMPEKYDEWRAAHAELEEGYEGAPTRDGFYHPEVYERRARRRGTKIRKPGGVSAFDHEARTKATEDVKDRAKKRAKNKPRTKPAKGDDGQT